MSTQDQFQIPYKLIINHLAKENSLRLSLKVQTASCFAFICQHFHIEQEQISDDDQAECKKKMGSFISNLEKRYRKQSYHIDRVLSDSWSNSHFILPFKLFEIESQKTKQINDETMDYQDVHDTIHCLEPLQNKKSKKKEEES